MGRFETKICIRVEIENGQNFLKGQVHGIKDQVQIDFFLFVWLLNCALLDGLTPKWIHVLTNMDFKALGHQITSECQMCLSVINECCILL